MLPSLKDEDFDKFLKLVLEMREEMLETEMPPFMELSTSVLQAFRDQLERAYLDYFYQVRTSMVAAFTIMKKCSYAVRAYLHRHEGKEQDMEPKAVDDATAARQQLEELTSQVHSLRPSL